MKNELKQSLLRLLIALLIGLLVSSVFILFAGENPLAAYATMLEGAFMGQLKFMTTLRWTVPYMLAGIASAVAVRAGLFNMGLEGCIYLGGLAAGLVGAYAEGLPPLLHVAACLAAAMAVGVLWLLIPAFLKAYHGVNEVIMTWMLSYIAVLLCQFLAAKFQRSEDITSAVQQVRTPEILGSAALPKIVERYQLSVGIFIAIAVCIAYYFFANRSKAGYEHKMVGMNPKFAEYGGVNVRRVQFYSLLASGAIGGLTGAVEVLGVHGRYVHGFALDMGANGIMISLMGRLNPVGVPLAGFFMGAVQNGARAMAREMDVSLDTVRILIAVIVICITAEGLYELLRIKKKNREGD
ncbi:ABC transporter permease [Oscillibacter hominis]|uniref:ABC transporter permease n=1 Tax=Oscillibacter hominis TaxID=2763056 RepID=A0A7G9B854_9FIRM|nr:ABC transporter permease [Oscillibacter hominis]QNL45735.1 ABC transporter permease [Oscillibacter hominis]